MHQATNATLKSTAEPVMILGQVGAAAGTQRYLVQLPPQQPGHKPRYQEIRGERLQFSNR